MPNTSGTPLVINDATGTVISANFFNSGAINPSDGLEFVSVCIHPANQNGDITATITTDVGQDDDTLIKGYPQFLIGTKFGNQFETSFRYYSNTGLPADKRWPITAEHLGDANRDFQLSNLEYVSQDLGVKLPAFSNSLPLIEITLDIDEQNVVGAERDVMLESWFHDTSANADLLGNAANGLAVTNTLNNIVGIGHPHYSELDNTLLEMMVHIGPLSPNDISGATRNPGQNQLTENFSGMDSDGDGIDNHFDVDSHVNVNNNLDPQPGIYSSGIDANSDGIDDADILPVQIGSYLYSIWYGESFLSPIIIYSRETNISLQNDFDPLTPDMDLSIEGEINLRWNDFLEYTLNNMEQQLRSAGVEWADGVDNPFPKMSSSTGAISGIELGVEPQTNNPNDLPYSAVINKFDVLIDGKPFGLTDTTAPTATFTNPTANHSTIDESPTLTGAINDTGGSGVGSVTVAIWDHAQQAYVDLNGNTTPNNALQAVLSATNTATATWSLDTSLPDGNYWVVAYPFDASGNYSAANRISSNFSVVSVNSDSIPPTAQFTNPAQNHAELPDSPTLTGTIDDTGGSGVGSVTVAIWGHAQQAYVDLNGNTTSNNALQADLSATNTATATWSLDTSLPDGNYWVVAYPFDAAGNYSAANRISSNFSVASANSDSVPPTATFTNPAQNHAELGSSPTLTGTINDIGGSGVGTVTIAIWDHTQQTYVDLNGNTTSNNALQAALSATNTASATWSLDTFLPSGNYWVVVFPFDDAGNYSTNNRISTNFSVTN